MLGENKCLLNKPGQGCGNLLNKPGQGCGNLLYKPGQGCRISQDS